MMTAPALIAAGLLALAAQTAPAADPKDALVEDLARAAARVEELTGAKFLEAPKARLIAALELRERARRDFAREWPEKLVLRVRPDGPDLGPAWRKLVTDDALSHYDPAEQTILLSEDLEPELRAAVLLQELTRLIVRQHQAELAPPTSLDEALARAALREGTAILAGLLSAYEPGRGIEALKLVPDLPQALRDNLEAQHRSASLSELVLFAPIEGAGLAQAIIAADAWGRLPELWRAPPRSTAEVLSPGRYLGREADFVDYAEDVSVLNLPGCRRVVSGCVGALGLRLWFRDHWPEAGDPAFAAAWSGDRMAVFQNRGPDRAVVLWRTAWRDEQEAQGFATMTMRMWKQGLVNLRPVTSEPGHERVWRGGSGLQAIERRGREVLILEQVPEERYDAVRKAAWEGLKANPRQKE